MLSLPPELGIFCRVAPPKGLFLPRCPAGFFRQPFDLTALLYLARRLQCLCQPPAWESLWRRLRQSWPREGLAFPDYQGSYRCRTQFWSDYRARSRLVANSRWSPTISRTSTPPATKPTVRCSRNFSIRPPAPIRAGGASVSCATAALIG